MAWSQTEKDATAAAVIPLQPDKDGVIPSWPCLSVTRSVQVKNPRSLQDATALRPANCDIDSLHGESWFGKLKRARLHADVSAFPLASVECNMSGRGAGAIMDHAPGNFLWGWEYGGSYLGLFLEEGASGAWLQRWLVGCCLSSPLGPAHAGELASITGAMARNSFRE